jgi:glutathione S-transferase
MKLYLAPGACSLADHIALREAGIDFEPVKVDLRTKRTENGEDFNAINPKGYVPALVFDDGQLLTENAAILSWIANRAPELAPEGEMGRIRLIETLSFLSSELHKPFGRLFFPVDDADKQAATKAINRRLAFLANRLQGDYLFGGQFSAADAYLFVMLQWAQNMGIEAPEPLAAFRERVKARPAVQEALREEGLT